MDKVTFYLEQALREMRTDLLFMLKELGSIIKILEESRSK